MPSSACSWTKPWPSGQFVYFDAKPAYLVRVAELIDVQPIKDAGLKVVVDNMWGNGAGWLSEILDGGKTEIIEVHAERNPSFPEMSRPEPIPPNVDAGLAVGKKVGADCVCILDGDADRCGFGDEHGEFIDQLRVYGLLAYYLLEIRGQRGTIVKTLSTTSMLDKLGKLYGVPVVNTGVGFKYVAPAMMEHDALIGGEESGGYAFRNHVPERDGIFANLYLLDLMVRTGKTPTELLAALFEKVGEHFYDRIDTRLTDNDMKVAAKTRLNALQNGYRRPHPGRQNSHRVGHHRRLQVRHGGRRLAPGALQRHGAVDPGIHRNHGRKRGGRHLG